MKTVLLLLCIVLAGCATQPYSQPKPAVALTGAEADVYEAVFRHQFVRNASSAQQSAGTYFIQIREADPSEAFLLRFSGHTPTVKPASQARLGRHSVVYDPQTHQESLVFEVRVIRWHGKDSAEVEGGYYKANLSSSGNTYRLIRRGTKWKVIKDTMSWISDSGRLPAKDRHT